MLLFCYFHRVKIRMICRFDMVHMLLLCWIFVWCKDVICWCICIMFGRVLCYVSHDSLRYVTTRALTFMSSRYFSSCYVNFHFVTLTQSTCYILYAYSWFNFDMCILAVIYVLCVCRCYLACRVLPCTIHCVALNHCVREHFSFHYINFFVVALPIVMLLFCFVTLIFVCLRYLFYAIFHFVALPFVMLHFISRVTISLGYLNPRINFRNARIRTLVLELAYLNENPRPCVRIYDLVLQFAR